MIHRRRKMIEWFLEEIPELERQQVLDASHCQRLSAYYSNMLRDEIPGRLSLSVVLLGILSALLIGGGTVLVFAHNWDELSRSMRAVISLSPLSIGLLMGGLILKQQKGAVWREPIAVYLITAATAALGLICQTYHLGGDLTQFVEVVLWMTLLLPFVFKSEGAALVNWILILQWSWLRYGDRLDINNAYLYSCVPLSYYLLSRHSVTRGVHSLRGWVVTLFVTAMVVPIFERKLDEAFLEVAFLSLFIGMSLFPLLKDRYSFLEASTIPTRVVGTAGMLICLLIPMGSHFYRHVDHPEGAAYAGGLLLPIICAGMAFVLGGKNRSTYFCALGILPLCIWFVLGLGLSPDMSVLTYCIVLGLVGVVGIIEGAYRGDLLRLNLGFLMTVFAILCKFFDSDLPILIRGIVFIAIGLILVVINFWVIKIQKRMNIKEGV